MKFSGTAAIVLRYFYLLRNSPARLFPMFVWVTIDILLWGFFTKYLGTVTTSGLKYVPMFLGAVVLWDFFIRIMHGVTSAFLEDVWSRNFLNIFATPLTISDYLGGLVITSIFTSMLGLAVMLVLATAVFGLSFLPLGLMLIPFLLVLFTFGIALGIFGCGMVLRLGPSAEWFTWTMPAIVSPFVGVFYPLETLPVWMRMIGRALPPSYVFEGMRAILTGGTLPAGTLVTGIGLSVLILLAACFFFASVHRHAIRSGLIARYSAESVG